MKQRPSAFWRETWILQLLDSKLKVSFEYFKSNIVDLSRFSERIQLSFEKTIAFNRVGGLGWFRHVREDSKAIFFQGSFTYYVKLI